MRSKIKNFYSIVDEEYQLASVKACLRSDEARALNDGDVYYAIWIKKYALRLSAFAELISKNL